MKLEVDGMEQKQVPAAAALVRDFVNSREPELDSEGLPDPASVAVWFEARGLWSPGGAASNDDVRRVRAIREGLRAVLREHAGHDSAEDVGSVLDAALAEVPLVGRFSDGRLRLTAASDTPVDRAMAAVLDAVRQTESDGVWHRLKACARPTCQWAYYDGSRNQSRRWCSMDGCGNISKMRARAERARREGAAATGR